MKKKTALIAFLLLFCIVFSACGSPSQGETETEDSGASFGKPKTFEKEGISLLLTDRFEESESSRVFYAYYAADFCSVFVSREFIFSAEGLADQNCREYLENSAPGITVRERDGLFYYTKDSSDRRVYAYCFKGSDSFWVVQYLCWIGDTENLEDLFHQWAKGVKVD